MAERSLKITALAAMINDLSVEEESQLVKLIDKINTPIAVCIFGGEDVGRTMTAYSVRHMENTLDALFRSWFDKWKFTVCRVDEPVCEYTGHRNTLLEQVGLDTLKKYKFSVDSEYQVIAEVGQQDPMSFELTFNTARLIT